MSISAYEQSAREARPSLKSVCCVNRSCSARYTDVARSLVQGENVKAIACPEHRTDKSYSTDEMKSFKQQGLISEFVPDPRKVSA